jgi:hypothetical protein
MAGRLAAGLRATLACLAIGSFLAGCGSEGRGLTKWPVEGEITFDGKHLPDGTIFFLHETGEIASVNFGDDGRYRVEVAEGANNVLVKSADITPGKAWPGGREMEVHKTRIPQKYSDAATSGLQVVVKASENTYDVPLTSETSKSSQAPRRR